MQLDDNSWSSSATTDIPRTTTSNLNLTSNATSSASGIDAASATETQSVFRLRINSTTVSTILITSRNHAIATTTFLYRYSTSTSASTLNLSASPTSTRETHNLSPSAAMGIGVTAGVLGIVILITAALFIYRCWKVRHSPRVRDYEQARLWKGFTPATPSTARTTLVEPKTANIYFTELRSPATPAFTLSPPLDRHERSWPVTPDTQRSPPTELSV